MDIGFIGLGNMGAHMARRLIEAGHKVTIYDTRQEALGNIAALGGIAARSPKEVADAAETVMVSLPSLLEQGPLAVMFFRGHWCPYCRLNVRAVIRAHDRIAAELFGPLGAETALSALARSSVIAVSYGPEEQPIGALAVIGPMRMNYGKVMSVVDVTAETLSQLLAELGGAA